MSAIRDKSQRVAFVYSNLYQLYKKSNETVPVVNKSFQPYSHIMRIGDLQPGNISKSFQVRAYKAPELLGKRLEARNNVTLTAANLPSTNATVQGLKDNLKTLDALHRKLQFMLKELEELVKE